MNTEYCTLIKRHPFIREPCGHMPFIELTGQTLLEVVNDGEIDVHELHRAGVHGTSILRVNEHGEIELRSRHGWRLVGGLIGNFADRLRDLTGLDFVD